MTLSLTGLLLASAAYANTVQINVVTEVEQDVQTLVGHPDFEFGNDPNFPPLGIDPSNPDRFIFFDEHKRILEEEANVWDPSQIPAAPDPNGFDEVAFANDPDGYEAPAYNVVSTGILDGTWNFDASVLDQNLAELASGEVTLLDGNNDLLSSFRITSLGQEVENGTANFSQVLAANNISASDLGIDPASAAALLGDNGGFPFPPQVFAAEVDTDNSDFEQDFRFDVIAIQAANTADQGVDFDGDPAFATLLLVGSGFWFESAQFPVDDQQPGPVDVTQALAAFIDVNERVSDTEGNGLFEVSISGMSSTIGIRGGTEELPLLPDQVNEDGGFEFDLIDLGDNELVFIDPIIAIGYTYEMTGAGQITAIVAPSGAVVNDPDGYLITLDDGTEFSIDPGEEITIADFTNAAVRSFVLTGIAQNLELDPDDPAAFVTGLRFSGTDNTSNISQTALRFDTDISAVPLPAGGALLIGGLAVMGAMSRRRKQSQAQV